MISGKRTRFVAGVSEPEAESGLQPNVLGCRSASVSKENSNRKTNQTDKNNAGTSG